MSADTSVPSNAFNFMQSLQSGVDPRTGQYRISLDLPELKGNDLRGPGFSLALAFSALNTTDSGYGIGWNVQLSEYDMNKQVLSTSTGERHTVTANGVDGELLMETKKLDSFRFFEYTPFQDKKQFMLVHKTGTVEILRERGMGSDRVAVPIEIYSPLGHRLVLAYTSFNGHTLLQSVNDDAGIPLLSVRRDAGKLDLDLYPNVDEALPARARYTMTFDSGELKYARTIALPADESGQRGYWRFDYTIKHGHTVVTKVENPLGGSELIVYDSEHSFPGPSGRYLPRVSRHEIYPDGAPDNPDKVQVEYTYPDDKNFLGNTLPIQWGTDNKDPLIYQSGTYDYSTVETHYLAGKAVRSVKRTFNRFHSLILQTTTQGDNIQETETVYPLRNGSVLDQPNTYQLPTQVINRWRLKSNPTRQRAETETYTYDSSGNELTHVEASGITTTNVYYRASGEEDFPDNPYGFVCKVKSSTVTPAPDHEPAPTVRTHYRYIEIPPLARTPLARPVTLDEQVLVQVHDAGTPQEREETLQSTTYQYWTDLNDPLRHGQLSRQAVRLNGATTYTDTDYKRLFGVDFPEPAIQLTTTLSTDFDGVKKVNIEQTSALTGKLLLLHSSDMEISYEYDKLGRLVRETTAPRSSEFKAVRTYRYFPSAGVGHFSGRDAVNTRGITTRTQIDGLGRQIYEERDNVSETNPTRVEQTWKARYNGLGELIEETRYDYFEGRSFAYTTTYEYDDWGEQSCVTGPDGVQAHTEFNPIGIAVGHPSPWNGLVETRWRQGPGHSPMISGKSETRINSLDKPAQTASLDAQGQVLATRTYQYDGQGNCTQEVDELKRKTLYSYDPWSRMVTTTLPDQCVVSREYATHSRSELPTALWVKPASGSSPDPVLIGTQTFDGLERLTETQTGMRSETLGYIDDQLQPNTRTTAAGAVITYEYKNLQLTDQPTAIHSPDAQSAFDYHPVSARLVKAQNEQGSRHYEYDITNQVRSEQWVDEQGLSWETQYISTSGGQLRKRLDINHLNTVENVYEYDSAGLVTRSVQGSLEATFEYDALSRLSKTTSVDTDANTTLITELTYDDQDQEILRTITLPGHSTRTIEQVWYPDGQLKSRHLQVEEAGLLNSLLLEAFDYDDRGRLSVHTCSGRDLPKDEAGRAIEQQMYVFDDLDNITLRVSQFSGGASEVNEYFYADDDRCRLVRMTRSLDGGPTQEQTFDYDDNGNMRNDEQGQLLRYDSQSRLLEVRSVSQQPVMQYQYDGHDRLISSQEGTQAKSLRLYQGDELSYTVQSAAQTHFFTAADQVLGQHQPGDPSKNLLLFTDANGSVLGECQGAALRAAIYSAYGERSSEEPLLSVRAFNGEVRESSSGWYLLGNGYRAYNPVLMRFHSPDSFSPFGAGGVNPYCYCLGNPIRFKDPTGHVSSVSRMKHPDEDRVPGAYKRSKNWVTVAISAAVTVVAAIFAVITWVPTGGLSGLALAAAVIANVASVTAVGLGFVTTVIKAATPDDNEDALLVGQILDYAGMGISLVGAVGGYTIGRALANQTSKWSNALVMSGAAELPPTPVPVEIPRAVLRRNLPYYRNSAKVSSAGQTAAPPSPPAPPPSPKPQAHGLGNPQRTLLEQIKEGVELNKTGGPQNRPIATAKDQLAVAVAAKRKGASVNAAANAGNVLGEKTFETILGASGAPKHLKNTFLIELINENLRIA
ncbi:MULTISPECIES: RHS repeat-associated core domain-containing protein [Pseudomonas]|uniref:RHS repeat-associated core domain-containing protein n=1 Tax=Pseudomonas fluorescens TaxID=294 RepID=A0A165YWI9_PSEFL|nr:MULTISPECIES: RHS repeat-associated core domain-containing protein [Pseudomonas]AMZ70283.1 hypothetical protein TK06_03890 [Pseudomonas fluorescens]